MEEFVDEPYEFVKASLVSYPVVMIICLSCLHGTEIRHCQTILLLYALIGRRGEEIGDIRVRPEMDRQLDVLCQHRYYSHRCLALPTCHHAVPC